MNETTETSELDKFFERVARERERLDVVSIFHKQMHVETDGVIKLPYQPDDTYVNTNVYHQKPASWAREDDPNPPMVDDHENINVDATLDKLALILTTADKLGYGISKDYSDEQFTVKVVVAEKSEHNHKLTVSYYAKRDAVCKKVVVGYEDVAEVVIPARQKEIVEWECEPVSLIQRAKEL